MLQTFYDTREADYDERMQRPNGPSVRDVVALADYKHFVAHDRAESEKLLRRALRMKDDTRDEHFRRAALISLGNLLARKDGCEEEAHDRLREALERLCVWLSAQI